MGSTVRSIGYSKSNSFAMQKTTGLLSDGTRVVCVHDANQTGVSGDGGDGTGVAKAYFYTSSNGATWTLRATVTTAIDDGRPFGSMSIGANNNIHFCYRDSDGSIKYVLLTYSAGPTYSVGSVENVYSAPPAGEAFVRVDIDVCGTSNNAVIAGGYRSLNSGDLFYRLRAKIRTNGGSWSDIGNNSVISNDKQAPYTDSVYVAGDQSAIGGDNLTTFCVTVNRKQLNGSDSGDWIYFCRVNVSTGGSATWYKAISNLNANQGGGYRPFRPFWVGADSWVVAGSIGTAPIKYFVGKLTLNRATMSSYTQNVNWSSTSNHNADRSVEVLYWSDVAYVGNNKFMFISRETSAGYRKVTMATINANGSVTWSPAANLEDTYLPGSSVPAAQIHAGTPRNYLADRIPVATSYYSNSYQYQYFEKLLPSVGTVTSPGAGTVSLTGQPILKATHKMQVSKPPLRTKIEFYLATDSGFTSNVRTVTEPDSDLLYANGTTGSTTVVSEEVVPAISALFGGTWFLRARVLDEAGSYGSYTPTVSFSVGHAPSAANLNPSGNAVVVYGSGNVTFSWTFTDPYEGDAQTAYQVIVRNVDTSATVVDTGKIASSTNSAVIAIPAGSKDTDLSWTVKLWDQDDTAGSESVPALFLVTDGPTPAITSPTASQVLAAANPTVTWTNGISLPKEQTHYRVTVSTTGVTVYDSNWIASTAVAHAIPTGYLANLVSYTVTVRVRDSLSLEAQATQLFSTSWTLPATRTPLSIYLSEYSRYGYVYVTLDPAGFDADFIAFNVYRRKYGETEWTRLASIPKNSDVVAYKDFTAGAGVTYEYAVTQLVDRFGDIVESAVPSSAVLTVKPQSDSYWLLHPTDTTKSIPLFSVTADAFTDEYETETYNVIGRGRHVDYGDHLGNAGSLTAQLRDRVLGGVERRNYVINPNMTYIDPGPTPYGWTATSGGTVGTIDEDYIQTQEPSPSGSETVYRISASAMGTASNTDFFGVTQLIVLDPTIQVGDNCTFSIWVNDVAGSLTGRRVEIGMRWETAGAALVRDDVTQSPTSVETYTSTAAGSPDYGSGGNPVSGHWKRYTISGLMPSTAAQVRVRLLVEGTGTGTAGQAKQLVLTGAQFEEGSISRYFDGDKFAAEWIGPEQISTSYTSGYFTARAQRLRLEEMKEERIAFYLRNPFGDIDLVAMENVAVTRIPGTGPVEFTDVTIPYKEVAF